MVYIYIYLCIILQAVNCQWKHMVRELFGKLAAESAVKNCTSEERLRTSFVYINYMEFGEGFLVSLLFFFFLIASPHTGFWVFFCLFFSF